MVKKCVKAVFDVLDIINKKTFLAVFIVVIFSFCVCLSPFQVAEETKISVQVAEAEEEEAADPCDGNTTCGECENCDTCDCTCSCSGVLSQGGGATGSYLENRDCHLDNSGCLCCSCSPSCSWGCWYDMEWCGDGTQNNSEQCDGYDPSPAANTCLMANGYDGLNLCDRCDWQYIDEDGGTNDSQVCDANTGCSQSEAQCDCSPADGRTCSWEAGCTQNDWCGDDVKNGPEECDAYDNQPTEAGNGCTVPNYDYPAGLPNDGLSDTVPYKGFYLCDKCDWQYTDIDTGPLDTQICAPITNCVTTPSCVGTGTYLWEDDSTYTGTGTCLWDTLLECTAVDWCGDGNINGPELYCDIHIDAASGTVTEDFGGQTCASKICSDIDSDDLEDKSLYSKNSACAAEVVAKETIAGVGSLTCVNTCRHIYTVPACEFPLNANGVDLSDDGQYVFVTDSSLWSLQMFPASTPANSTANSERLLAIYYFNTEPLSVDVVGDYAYVGTKGEFSVINTVQLYQPDAFPDPGDLYVFPPFTSKDPPLPFQEEQVLPTVATIPIFTLWGEVNDVHVVGRYAYLAVGTAGASGPAALVIVDISNPLAPAVVNTYTFNASTLTGAKSVDVSGNYAYVAYTDGSAGVGYFEYIDIFDKNNLSLKKSIDIGSSTNSIDISGNYAFIDGFSTFNSVDILLPFVASSVHVTDNLNLGPRLPIDETFGMDINDSGDIAYVSVGGIGLRAVDISNSEDISEGVIITAPGNAPAIVDIIINTAGEYAYAAGLSAGLLVFKIEQDCGDGVLNGFEVCDGDDLGGTTCANIGLGFAEGDLLCKRFCNAFDTSACIKCGDAGFSDPNCACNGVDCSSGAGFCEMNPGTCKVVNNAPVCVYPNNPNKCPSPLLGSCQIGPGICDEEANVCRYRDDSNLCDLDGDVCTGDRCVSPDWGITSECLAGSNICGGLVPCDRMVNDPSTPWDDTASCGFCHGIMLLNQGTNFLLEIAGIVAVLVLIIAGFLFVTSAGNPERKNNAKTVLKWVIVGFLILLLSWLIVDFILSAWGFLDPLGGKWNVVCE